VGVQKLKALSLKLGALKRSSLIDLYVVVVVMPRQVTWASYDARLYDKYNHLVA